MGADGRVGVRAVGQLASRRRASASRASTVESTTSDPIRTRSPPSTDGSTVTFDAPVKDYSGANENYETGQ